MSLESEWKERFKAFSRDMGRAIESNIFYGPQPTQAEDFVAGWCTSCPACGGRGFDDSGPGAWSCGVCDRQGTLVPGKVYHWEKYLPYPDDHPNKGTKFDHEGKWKF